MTTTRPPAKASTGSASESALLRSQAPSRFDAPQTGRPTSSFPCGLRSIILGGGGETREASSPFRNLMSSGNRNVSACVASDAAVCVAASADAVGKEDAFCLESVCSRCDPPNRFSSSWFLSLRHCCSSDMSLCRPDLVLQRDTRLTLWTLQPTDAFLNT